MYLREGNVRSFVRRDQRRIAAVGANAHCLAVFLYHILQYCWQPATKRHCAEALCYTACSVLFCMLRLRKPSSAPSARSKIEIARESWTPEFCIRDQALFSCLSNLYNRAPENSTNS